MVPHQGVLDSRFDGTLNFIFNSDHFCAVEKPAEWLTTPSRSQTDPRPCLGRELQRQLGVQIYPVHRLDFEVSGLVLFAKFQEAHRRAQVWFETGVVEKTYHALSRAGHAEPPWEWDEWHCRLVRGKRRAFEAAHGKEARTRARVVTVKDPSEAATFVTWKWELQPLTGRSHQLRYEMARHGYPILGDTLYGADPRTEPGIALRAVGLDFTQVPAENRLGLPALLRSE